MSCAERPYVWGLCAWANPASMRAVAKNRVRRVARSIFLQLLTNKSSPESVPCREGVNDVYGARDYHTQRLVNQEAGCKGHCCLKIPPGAVVSAGLDAIDLTWL